MKPSTQTARATGADRPRPLSRSGASPPSPTWRSSRSTRRPHLDAFRYDERLGDPGEYPYTRGAYPSMYRGKLWTMRQFAGFGTPEDTNARFRFLLAQGQTGLSTAFDMPTLMGYDADHPRALGEVGPRGRRRLQPRRHGGALRRHPARPGHHLDDRQLQRQHPAGDVLRHGRAARHRRSIALGGTIQNDMLKEFIAQKEWICPPEPSVRDHRRHDRVLRRARAALASGLDLRLPHPRSRLDRRAGAGLHARRRHRLRAGGDRARPRRRRLRAAPVVLLQRAQRLPRRGRQVSRRAPHVGDDHARALRRAASRARGMLRTHAQTAGCSLTAQQPLNNVVRVAIQALAGGARRRQLAAHQLDGRDAGAADRDGRAHRAAHAADHRRGERRHQHRRSARRQLRDRGAHRPARARGVRLHRHASTSMGGIIRAIELGFPQKEIADAVVPLPAPARPRREGHRRRQQVRDRRRHRRSRSCASATTSSATRRRACASASSARDSAAVRERLAAVRSAARDGREPHAADHRRRARRMHRRRDLRHLPRGLRGVPRSRPGSEDAACRIGGCASWSPSPGSTGTTAARRSSPAPCATPASR